MTVDSIDESVLRYKTIPKKAHALFSPIYCKLMFYTIPSFTDEKEKIASLVQNVNNFILTPINREIENIYLEI